MRNGSKFSLLFAVLLTVASFGAADQSAAQNVARGASQNYPNRPITYYFPFSPGPGDASLRLISEKFRERTGQPIVIEYRVGANTMLATQALLRAPTDGYHIVFASSASMPYNSMAYILPYSLDDFAPITLLADLDQALIVSPNVPAKTFQEFIVWSKTRPQVSFANVNPAANLMMTIMAKQTGIPWVEVPYKGGAEMQAAVVSGQADFGFQTINESLIGLEKDGKVKILALVSPKRAKNYPNLPAVNEYVPGFELYFWTGVVARAGTPKPIVDFLFKEITTAALDPEILKKTAVGGRIVITSSSPEEFDRKIKAEYELLSRVARAAGFKPQPL